MSALIKFLAALPGVITGVKSILEIFTRYFPPKSEATRAVEDFKDKVVKVREVQLETSKKIREAKLGKTKAVESIINNPKR